MNHLNSKGRLTYLLSLQELLKGCSHSTIATPILLNTTNELYVIKCC